MASLNMNKVIREMEVKLQTRLNSVGRLKAYLEKCRSISEKHCLDKTQKIRLQVIEQKIKQQQNKHKAFPSYEKAVQLMKDNSFGDALFELNYAIHIDPTVGKYYCTRAELLSKLGNKQMAINDCNSAIAVDSRCIQSLERLGKLYFKMDDFQKAYNYFERALLLNSPDREYYAHKMRLCKTGMEIGGEALKHALKFMQKSRGCDETFTVESNNTEAVSPQQKKQQ